MKDVTQQACERALFYLTDLPPGPVPAWRVERAVSILRAATMPLKAEAK